MSVQRGNLNLTIYEYSLWFPCVNFISFASRPLPSSTSKVSPFLDLTPTGFPTNFTVGADIQTYIRGNSDNSAVTYVAKWRGSAIYNHNSFSAATGGDMSRTYGNQSWASGALNGSAQVNGRITFTLSGASSYTSNVTIKGDATAGTNPLTELVVCRLDEEDYYDTQRQAGVLPAFVFSQTLITELKSGKWSALRMMGSLATNSSPLSRWAERPPTNPLTLLYKRFPKLLSSDGTPANQGQIANTGDVYSGQYGSSGAYIHGEIYQGVVLSSNTTTTPTLNVDGRGAKTIQTGITAAGQVGPPITTGTNSTYRLISGVMYTFIYDANYDSWVYVAGALETGYPWEWLIALANAVGQTPWFNIPLYADDDFVTQFGNLIASTSTNAFVKVEYANEIWNTQGGDIMTVRAEKAGLVHFTSPQIGTTNLAASSGWYGLRFRQIATILRPILGSKLKMMLASRGGAGDVASNLVNEVENVRLQNTNYPELTGSNAPYKFADALSYALYFIPSTVLADDPNADGAGWAAITQASGLKTQIDAWVGNNTLTTGFDWLKAAWLADTAYLTLVNANGRHDNWNKLAVKYNIPVEMYEGNHQIKYPTSTWTAANAPWSNASYGGVSGSINLFLKAFFKSQQYQDVITSYLTSFYGYSYSVSCSLLAIVGAQPWPSHDFPNEAANASGSIMGTPFGNYLAHKAWNNRTTRTFTLKN